MLLDPECNQGSCYQSGDFRQAEGRLSRHRLEERHQRSLQVVRERLGRHKSLQPPGRSPDFTTRSKLSLLATDLFNFVAANEAVLSNVEGREGVVHPGSRTPGVAELTCSKLDSQ